MTWGNWWQLISLRRDRSTLRWTWQLSVSHSIKYLQESRDLDAGYFILALWIPISGWFPHETPDFGCWKTLGAASWWKRSCRVERQRRRNPLLDAHPQYLEDHPTNGNWWLTIVISISHLYTVYVYNYMSIYRYIYKWDKLLGLSNQDLLTSCWIRLHI